MDQYMVSVRRKVSYPSTIKWQTYFPAKKQAREE